MDGHIQKDEKPVYEGMKNDFKTHIVTKNAILAISLVGGIIAIIGLIVGNHNYNF